MASLLVAVAYVSSASGLDCEPVGTGNHLMIDFAMETAFACRKAIY